MVKKFTFFFCLFLSIVSFGKSIFIENDSTKKWLDKLEIGQSLETTDQSVEPAQIQLTFPKKDTSSILLNFGLSYKLNSRNNFISKIKIEYHKNTLIKKKQNNFEIGYQGTLFFRKTNTSYYLLFDPKYNYDAIDLNSSFASNILFSWLKKDGSGIKWNVENYNKNNRTSFFVSLFSGIQYQNIINSGEAKSKGNIVRPLINLNFSYSINGVGDGIIPEQKLTFGLAYTVRFDAINTTNNAEGYTKLLKLKADWYFLNDPLKLSLGASINSGSDPIKGLKNQTFYLISLNISKPD